ncbi:PHD finger protein 7-like [Gallus gallus]|uniref:PHD finger protein 7-like n=1 Tax=Gallus gallus TaxID=9031 RepID=UPI001AEA2C16|nr:PHD finger protein 7-like [Gallus gallus]
MVCPACAHCWFHRGCIQQQALNAGAWCFRCPSCQDILLFLAEMFLMGIHIPLRRPLWEESDAYESLLERHSRCNACECLYRGGREQAEREGPWQLILCSSCAAQGTHRRCSTLADTADSWECDSCAGLGTASSANMEHAGSSSASREGLRPSHSSSVPENISSASTSQAASGPSLRWSTPNSEVLWVELEVMAAKPQRTKAVLPVHGSQECGHTGRGPLRRLSRARQSTPHLKVASTKKEREELW